MLTQIDVEGRYLTGDGNPVQGHVDFALSQPVRDTVSGVIVDREKVSAVLDDGQASIDIYATDDPTDSSLVAVYHLTERFDGAPLRQGAFPLPHASPGGSFDLSTLG